MRLLALSPGSWIIAALAFSSALALLFVQDEPQEGQSLWIFSTNHRQIYDPVVREWNERQSAARDRVSPLVISLPALERRLLSGFLSGTQVPDLVEVETSMASRFFAGPVESIGLTDLTDRLREENLDREIHPPSFSPWSRAGRIYGLPHDIHPVLLAYRADIVEAAGIEVGQIETWDDFIRTMKPLQVDLDGDGQIDRYLLDVWETEQMSLDILLLQAGGAYFNRELEPVLDSEINARVLATIVTWTNGETRIGVNITRFDAAGNQQRINGVVVCHLLADWYAGGFMKDMPGLAGKLKLMPLPAWEKGGRRTSVIGGTMLSIPKRTEDFEAAWRFAKELYLDPRLAERLYKSTMIVSPVKKNWTASFYDDPIPYFCGQPAGRLYLEVAPQIPERQSAPLLAVAKARVLNALIESKRRAVAGKLTTVEEIVPIARAELAIAQRYIERKLSLNRFLQAGPKSS